MIISSNSPMVSLSALFIIIQKPSPFPAKLLFSNCNFPSKLRIFQSAGGKVPEKSSLKDCAVGVFKTIKLSMVFSDEPSVFSTFKLTL
ncbi:hypothetical protein G1K73_06720 [Tenacibaculum finnmarkense]|uniref:hypothetical protein n=1 Tax=Tenacibaculum finnmarkense TaxID=2781243 RepID=UPI001EFAF417|nr:hypothetical protein [Tenacibaculum finnmarkense]MCG8893445.1 hypothetical protein [Tenacibaculum finnmarkense]